MFGRPLTVYQHVMPGMQADAATLFSDLIANGGSRGVESTRMLAPKLSQ